MMRVKEIYNLQDDVSPNKIKNSANNYLYHYITANTMCTNSSDKKYNKQPGRKTLRRVADWLLVCLKTMVFLRQFCMHIWLTYAVVRTKEYGVYSIYSHILYVYIYIYIYTYIFI